ncbi:ankyrin repeat domain-containing protein 66 isoform X2 [Nematostella vectensis]|uniref:ankyrin repeat domain-containing protein 66 isoform X2 n=1 Tax=Nematostella vectensis TaxID=45351 RepID=UPI00138FE6D9|nr:ankyrin repeat domain-containing protein 66 isoform X2 [Nematostella vectensis]XP_032242309.1 ankyrin repeat domain-containing protein 66 isoform X2 [Nematostella vectensis]XP_048582358.1 ankyrin repeat domain-containing protein 66 isoform X2 [Nematostella vectensis]XP_048582359.1 ankyrin repeat domain-containing protein 66 isoform X2 [Nematostella vectensis]
MQSELVLHEAAATGSYQDLQPMLMMGRIDPNFKDEDFGDRTALHWAASRGHARCVKLLLEYGANPGAKMVGGWTPAHCAAETGRYNVLKVLVDHHAPVTLPDDSGDTPKRVAEIYGHTDCLELLCSAETNENQRKHFVKDKFRSQTRKISRMVDTKDQQAPAVLD